MVGSGWLLRTAEFRRWCDGAEGGGSGRAALFCCGDLVVGKTYFRRKTTREAKLKDGDVDESPRQTCSVHYWNTWWIGKDPGRDKSDVLGSQKVTGRRGHGCL